MIAVPATHNEKHYRTDVVRLCRLERHGQPRRSEASETEPGWGKVRVEEGMCMRFKESKPCKGYSKVSKKMQYGIFRNVKGAKTILFTSV